MHATCDAPAGNLEHAREVRGRLGHDGVDIALEDQKVSGAHEDAFLGQHAGVLVKLDDLAVEAVLADVAGGHAPLEAHLHAVGALVHGTHDGLFGHGAAFVRGQRAVHQVGQVAAPQDAALHAQHERDGVHDIGLAYGIPVPQRPTPQRRGTARGRAGVAPVLSNKAAPWDASKRT